VAKSVGVETVDGKTTVIDLLRHGEPKGGIRIRGWQDDPLSESGWQQLWSAVAGERPWQAIVCSPLTRCRQFAQRLAEAQRIQLREEPRLREIGFGQWEGADPDELHAAFPQQVKDFWDDPVANTPPGAEPVIPDFRDRVQAAMETIISEYAGQHVLVVAHGGVNRMLISQVLGMPASNLFRLEVPFAAVSRISIEKGTARLSFHCRSA